MQHLLIVMSSNLIQKKINSRCCCVLNYKHTGNTQGVLKLLAACHGLSNQQQLDLWTHGQSRSQHDRYLHGT